MSVNAKSPADIFGGTWEALDQGRVLIGAGMSHPAGETGGEETHTLSVEEMPSHDHSCSNDGSHSHGGSAVSAGEHTHTRGTMEITGQTTAVGTKNTTDDDYPNRNKGAFYQGSASEAIYGTGGTQWDFHNINFAASRTWQGSTSSAGSHSHSLSINSNGDHTHSIGSAGSGAAHNNMPPYLSVYMWRRTA